MAVTKMLAVTMSGSISRFDDIVNKYIYKRDIHLENAMSILGAKHKLYAFEDTVQYDSVVKTAESVMALAGFSTDSDFESSPLSLDEMNDFLAKVQSYSADTQKQHDALTEQINNNSTFIGNLSGLSDYTFNLAELGAFRFIRYRFGHIPKGGYRTLVTYLSDMDIIFVKTGEDESNVYGFYFVSESGLSRADEIFTSLYFEKIELPDAIEGNPKEVIQKLKDKNIELEKKIVDLSIEAAKELDSYKKDIISVYKTALKRQDFAEVRQNAAHSDDLFYIVGWMAKNDATALEAEIKKEEGVVLFYTESPENLKNIVRPPTKLKNNFVFKPFEMFVKMYGYPSYSETDPTPILAVTYIIFFGMMFGDLGQSFVLALGGLIFGYIKKNDLAKIIGIVGISGMVFGVLYGSVFGNEEIIKGVLPPMDNITTLLLGTVSIGALIIVFSMLTNIVNCASEKRFGDMLFSHNGIAGVIFYVSMLLLVVSGFTDFLSLPAKPLVILMVASIIVIYLCEPLSELISGKKGWYKKDAMFFVQGIFELMEVLLSYFSNTISFLRIGALAIAHVGMMKVVAALAVGGTAKVIIVSILGNILVMVLEGMIVCIQVLRLEYYEMFSRYYSGNGKPFISLKDKK